MDSVLYFDRDVFNEAIDFCEGSRALAQGGRFWAAQGQALCARITFLAVTVLAVLYLPVGVIHGLCIFLDRTMRWEDLTLRDVVDPVISRVDRFFKGLVGALIAPSIVYQYREAAWGEWVIKGVVSIASVTLTFYFLGDRIALDFKLG